MYQITPADAATVARAMRMASRAVIADIESEAHRIVLDDGSTWLDLRPMLDPREHSPECLDMAREAIAYALDCRLVQPHPARSGLVRVCTPRDATTEIGGAA